MKKDDIIKLMQKPSLSAVELLLFINERITDDGRDHIPWDEVNQLELQHAIHTGAFSNAYKNCKMYFEQKWTLTSLKTNKKLIYIDSINNHIYY